MRDTAHLKALYNPLLRPFVAQLQADNTPALDAARWPKISVVMPSYNQQDFIERSILSVLNQHYPNLEFIIIDGGSTDGTVEVIRRYEQYLSVWLSEPDHGQSDALNKGFARATGAIQGWLNSDDLYMPGAFQRVAMEFERHPDRRIVHGDWLNIDTDDQLLAYEYSFDFNVNQLKYEGFPLNAQAMFWRREVRERFGQFDVALYNTMDYDMILRFGLNEGDRAFLRIPAVLGCFRRHEAQKTRAFDERVLNEHRRMAGLHGYADKYQPLGQAKRWLYRLRRAYWYLRRGGLGYLSAKTCEALSRPHAS